jgi:uracil-DNA glycosylase
MTDSGDTGGVPRASLARELHRYLAQQGEFGAPVLHVDALKAGVALASGLTLGGESATGGASGRAASHPAMETPPSRVDASGGVGAIPHGSSGSGVSRGDEGVQSSGVQPGGDPLPDTLGALRAHCAGCTRCGLSEGRTQTVFADGNPEARVMVVGEAPGANEDASGLPFVGAAGKLLDLLLATVGLSRMDSVYICNVVKCRPPGNRNPEPVEIEACAPYLRRQIELVRPEVILAVGTFSGRLLSGKDLPLGALRNEIHSFKGIPLIVTYHPAALLRNSGWIRPTWMDVQRLRAVLDGNEFSLHLPE